jgi:4a-hydroxytetrahydrobiopterin dehydratase
MTISDLESKSAKDVSIDKLEQSEIDSLASLFSNWELDEDGSLVTTFEMDNFEQAVSLVNAIAAIAEEENHHPDILIHDLKFVTLSLFSHSTQGLSAKDFVLAAHIEKLVQDEGEE